MSTGRAFPARIIRPIAIGISALFVSGCAGYLPGEKAYWDERVKELCAKDGGVRIFETIRLSREEAASMRKGRGRIGVPGQALAPPNSPVYAILTEQHFQKGNPQVTRTESSIVRRSDTAIVASWVVYRRSGGDFPSHAAPSSFECPDMEAIASDMQRLFVVEGDAK